MSDGAEAARDVDRDPLAPDELGSRPHAAGARLKAPAMGSRMPGSTRSNARRPLVLPRHDYPSQIHRLNYRRADHDKPPRARLQAGGRVHAALDMVTLNDLDRFT
jgi:hypothetical protein